ncbi:helix-turn-helix domain-containing protein [Streptomyces sp. ACA25]|uniref:helix-turn-helix transcriptional regulator n=1 Tax=Streptomyces sp. ACA25 TaxID=3022596 RepID=UPI00230736A1|nr:helix-turn-helix domain-containing protein [Streptomyces sp. ACA25]MDB1089953.1 helix-turn-helix domain-containing protein [Streptomyces sp. ACA25]
MSGGRVRQRRQGRNWSQADLAAAAGVSRQSIAAVEAGRQVPSVTAALGLAGALGCSVEELFAETGPETGSVLPVLVDVAEPSPGTPLTVARVASTQVWAPLHEPDEAGFRLADAVWSADGPTMLDGAAGNGFVVAGCEPALGMAAAAAPGTGAGRLVVVHASSGRSLAALAAGRAHAAVVHGPAGGLPPVPEGLARWELARWPVGLAHAGAMPPLGAVGAGRVPVAHRDALAASEQALHRALAAAGAPDRVRGPVAAGHLASARMTAAGQVAAGVTTAAAASAVGLRFTAWEEHVVQLWVDRRFAEHPGMSTLLQVWCSPRVSSQLRRLGGYTLAGAGQEVKR